MKFPSLCSSIYLYGIIFFFYRNVMKFPRLSYSCCICCPLEAAMTPEVAGVVMATRPVTSAMATGRLMFAPCCCCCTYCWGTSWPMWLWLLLLLLLLMWDMMSACVTATLSMLVVCTSWSCGDAVCVAFIMIICWGDCSGSWESCSIWLN